jgi:small-conductance mechanosensitive channel
MSRGNNSRRNNSNNDLPGWREINKQRSVLDDELLKVAPKVAAKEYSAQLGRVITIVSSPNEAPERVGLALNVLTELVIDMVGMVAEGSSSSLGQEEEEEQCMIADNGEALARASEEYNQRLTQLQAENEELRQGVNETREQFQAVSRDQTQLLETLERLRQERDRALASNAQMLEENESLKSKVKSQKKRLRATEEAVAALEEAEEEEKRLMRRKREKERARK